MSEALKSRNLMVNGRRTSMRLEPMLWEVLGDIARREKVSLNDLVSGIERRAPRESNEGVNLTATVRLFIMQYFKAAATEEGHRQAGHGVGNPFSIADMDARGDGCRDDRSDATSSDVTPKPKAAEPRDIIVI